MIIAFVYVEFYLLLLMDDISSTIFVITKPRLRSIYNVSLWLKIKLLLLNGSIVFRVHFLCFLCFGTVYLSTVCLATHVYFISIFIWIWDADFTSVCICIASPFCLYVYESINEYMNLGNTEYMNCGTGYLSVLMYVIHASPFLSLSAHICLHMLMA